MLKLTLFTAAQVIAGMKLRSEEVVLGQGTLRPDLIESASGLASNKVSSSKKSLEILYVWLNMTFYVIQPEKGKGPLGPFYFKSMYMTIM